jgi:hypothetical protein
MDDPLPEGLFSPDEEAIIVYARAAAAMQPITDDIWSGLREHFDVKSIMEICWIVGMNQLTSRFHALVLSDLDEGTSAQVAGGSCQVRLPTPPARAEPS